ncbi:MAG: TIGR03915 family putative DNA repair protein [Bacilli bacterium]|nr:TIGR03915 family putative DNA repair protein [Bacilli bacterium]
MIYLYKENFIDLLNLINYLLKNKVKPENIKNEIYMKTLLEETYYPVIAEDKNLSERIINKIGIESFLIVYYVFLSNADNKELLIYKYLLSSLKYKNKIRFMRNIDCVNECLKISKYVKTEAHKFKGFVRFSELDNGVLYSQIEPENNIMLLLCNHFKRRLKNECWVIKDNRRNLVGIYDKKECYILDSDIDIKKFDSEDYYEDMWKEFYKTIGIKERKNDRCRMNFMPKKYWKYIVEVSDNEKSSV